VAREQGGKVLAGGSIERAGTVQHAGGEVVQNASARAGSAMPSGVLRGGYWRVGEAGNMVDSRRRAQGVARYIVRGS
jgi:hypothetical protein